MKLKNKLLVYFIPSFLIFSGVISLFIHKTVVRIITESTITEGIREVSEAAVRAAGPLKEKSEIKLLPVLIDTKNKLNARDTFALDLNGTIIAHSKITERGRLFICPLRQSALDSQTPYFHFINDKNNNGVDILHVGAPIFETSVKETGDDSFLLSNGEEKNAKNRIGIFMAEISMKSAYMTADKITKQSLLILWIGGIVALIFLLLFLGRILDPLIRLTKATENIMAGNYNISIESTSKDEVGYLAQRFSLMSHELGRTTVSKDYLNNIINNILDPIFVINLDGLITLHNKAAETLLGQTTDTLHNHSINSLFQEEKEPILTLIVAEASKGTFRNVEMSLKAKNGDISVLASAVEHHDGMGQATGYIVVVRDITDRKKLEKQIFQSEKMSAIGQLAAGIAHEINNPLGIILGFAQSIKADVPGDSPLATGLNFIEKETLRCKELVQNLLVFSRSSQLDRKENVNIHDTVEEALTLITAQSRVKNIELIKDLKDTLSPIIANKNQIQQVIINLCNNAMDAMTDKGTLTVRTNVVQDKGTPWITIDVSDTGTGIPPNIQSKIFDPFFTTKETGKGTGLGLSLVFEIVQKHQGKIELKSEMGKGTTFTVFLPTQT